MVPVVGVCKPVTVVASAVSVVESLPVVDGVDAGSFNVVVVENSSIDVPVAGGCAFCVAAVTQALLHVCDTSTS